MKMMIKSVSSFAYVRFSCYNKRFINSLVFLFFILLSSFLLGQTKTYTFKYDEQGNLQERVIKKAPLIDVPEEVIQNPSLLPNYNTTLSSEASIGPNPASTTSTIFIKDYVPNTSILYTFYNAADGTIVLSGKFESASLTVDVNNLSVGIYFLVLSYSNKEVKQVMVKQ